MVSKDTHFDAALVPSASERGGRLSKNDHLAEFLFSARFFNVTFCSTSVYFGLGFGSIQRVESILGIATNINGPRVKGQKRADFVEGPGGGLPAV